jgi:hypothetical protein
MAWPTKTDFVDGDVLSAAQVNNIGTNLNEIDPTGITDGYVVTADGAGGLGWEVVPSGGITVIASGSLSTSALDLTSIPSTYKALELILTNASFNSTNNWGLQLNGQTGPTNGYAYVRQFTTTNTAAQTGTSFPIDNTWDSAASVSMNFYFPNYAVSSYQQGFYYSMNQSNGLGGYAVFNYRDSQFAINRIRIFSLSGATFDAGTYELRGLK